MAKLPEPAMDKAFLKRLLTQSTEAPVHCAFGITKDGGQILLDKIKNPKVLEKDLVKLFPDIGQTRFGEATVPQNDLQLVRVVVNRPVSGVAKKLTKALKGTGFKRIEILLEDGTLSEGAADEEDEAGSTTAAPSQASPAAASPAPAAGGPNASVAAKTGEDAAARSALSALATRMTTAKLPPEERAQLVASLKAGMAALSAGDAAGTKRLIAPVQQRLDTLDKVTAETGPIPAGAVVVGKAKLAWRASRAKVHGEVDTLRNTLKAAYTKRGLADPVLSAFEKKVGEVLKTFDEHLEDELDAIANAASPSEREKLIVAVKDRLKSCRSALEQRDITELDANPFVKLSIRQTMSGTLAVLESAIH